MQGPTENIGKIPSITETREFSFDVVELKQAFAIAKTKSMAQVVTDPTQHFSLIELTQDCFYLIHNQDVLDQANDQNGFKYSAHPAYLVLADRMNQYFPRCIALIVHANEYDQNSKWAKNAWCSIKQNDIYYILKPLSPQSYPDFSISVHRELCQLKKNPQEHHALKTAARDGSTKSLVGVGGNYYVVTGRCIGAGSFGRVYPALRVDPECRVTNNSPPVILKMFYPDYAKLENLESEARSAARAYDSTYKADETGEFECIARGEAEQRVDLDINGQGFIIIDFVAGTPLNHLINPDMCHSLNIEIRAALCEKLAAALRNLHDRNTAHGDVTANNFLVGCDGNQFKITAVDFGMADQLWPQEEIARILWVPELLKPGSTRPTPAADINRAGFVMTEILGCNHRAAYKARNESICAQTCSAIPLEIATIGPSYDAIPMFPLRIHEIQINVRDLTTEFITNMTAPDPNRRPNTNMVQIFFGMLSVCLRSENTLVVRHALATMLVISAYSYTSIRPLEIGESVNLSDWWQTYILNAAENDFKTPDNTLRLIQSYVHQNRLIFYRQLTAYFNPTLTTDSAINAVFTLCHTFLQVHHEGQIIGVGLDPKRIDLRTGTINLIGQNITIHNATMAPLTTTLSTHDHQLYAAPETIDPGQRLIGLPSEVFSLGLILASLLSGRTELSNMPINAQPAYLRNSYAYILEFENLIPSVHIKYLVTYFLEQMLAKDYTKRPNMFMVCEFFTVLARYIRKDARTDVNIRKHIAHMILLNAFFDLPEFSLEWGTFSEHIRNLGRNDNFNNEVIKLFIDTLCFGAKLSQKLKQVLSMHIHL